LGPFVAVGAGFVSIAVDRCLVAVDFADAVVATMVGELTLGVGVAAGVQLASIMIDSEARSIFEKVVWIMIVSPDGIGEVFCRGNCHADDSYRPTSAFSRSPKGSEGESAGTHC
jgi:hypothetical protein